MKSKQRINGLIVKANIAQHEAKGERRSFYQGAISAYRQALKIFEGELDQAGLSTDPGLEMAAVKFCKEICFYGHGDSRGEAAECAMCPLAGYTLGDLDVQEDPEETAKTEKRLQVERARRAVKRMRSRGLRTLSGYNDSRRMNPGGGLTEVNE